MLQNHLHACERLKSFCLRIEKYFPEPVRPKYTTNSGPSKPPLLKKNQVSFLRLRFLHYPLAVLFFAAFKALSALRCNRTLLFILLNFTL